MNVRYEGQRYFLVLVRGEEIVQSITDVLNEHNIHAGTIMGIGAASEVTLRYYDVETKEYYGKDFAGKFEIASLMGNISLLDGEPWPHLHIVLGATDYSTFGGHLASGTVGVTCEIVIDAAEQPIERVLDQDTGLKVWNL